MQLSVIIPTYNRPDILKECLERLFEQNIVPSEYEIIVVDDGSKPATRDLVKLMQKTAPCKVKYFYQENSGQGVARNRGLKYAEGKVSLFLGDDILVTKDFLKEHLNYHRKYTHENEAVLGFILWDPRLNINSLMEFLVNGSCILGRYGGHQFAYEKLEGKNLANFNFFYTSNISIKTSLLRKQMFDESFSRYGWEDIELGYRLEKKAGLKLYYNKKALAYHFHQLDEEDLKRRMKMIGESAHIFNAKYPELKKVPSFFKKFILSIFTSAPLMWFFTSLKKWSKGKFCNYYYYALSQKYLLEGLNKPKL